MDTASSVDAPLVRVIDGNAVSFPRFGIDHITKFGEKRKAELSEINQKLADKHRLDNWQRFRADQELEYGGVSVSDVLRYLKNTDGMPVGWKAICAEAGFTKEQADAYEKKLGPLAVAALLIDALSVPAARPDADKAGPTPPKT